MPIRKDNNLPAAASASNMDADATPPRKEPLLPPKYAAPFTDFKGLHRDVLPFYSERSLRELVRRGVVPSIRLPNSRKQAFHVADVIAALRRHTQGGVQ